MGNKELITLIVDKIEADRIRKDGLAEIVFRRVDAKFEEMLKCKVADNNVLEKALGLLDANAQSMDMVRSTIRKMDRNLGGQLTNLTASAKSMAMQVDRLYQATGIVKKISYLNTALSMANIAVDVAGFAIMDQKLGMVNTQVRQISRQVDKMAAVQRHGKEGEWQKLIMRFNAMTPKLKEPDEAAVDDMEKLLMDMRAFLSEMAKNIEADAMDIEMLLQMIGLLRALYTLLFTVYIREYYYEHQALPANYEMFISVYEELESQAVLDSIEDYYFIDKKLHSQEVLDILNAQTLLALNGKVQIEDQVSLLQILGNREKTEAFEKGLDNVVKLMVEEKIPEIARETGLDEAQCMQMFAVQG